MRFADRLGDNATVGSSSLCVLLDGNYESASLAISVSESVVAAVFLVARSKWNLLYSRFDL